MCLLTVLSEHHKQKGKSTGDIMPKSPWKPGEIMSSPPKLRGQTEATEARKQQMWTLSSTNMCCSVIRSLKSQKGAFLMFLISHPSNHSLSGLTAKTLLGSVNCQTGIGSAAFENECAVNEVQLELRSLKNSYHLIIQKWGEM